MIDKEADVLAAMLEAEGAGAAAGLRPMDFGGSNRSHHAQTAIRMVKKGWLERSFGHGWGKPKTPGERGSCRYRTTPAGRQALANHRVSRAATG